MASGAAVITTNWSGMTEYLTQANSYPLPIDGLVPVVQEGGHWDGHRWAEPSLSQLRRLMRRVVDKPEEAAAKGKRAREDMVAKYAPAVVAARVVERLREIAALAAARYRYRSPSRPVSKPAAAEL